MFDLLKVLLESNLDKFSNDVAIKYLNKYKKASESKGELLLDSIVEKSRDTRVDNDKDNECL